MSEKMRFFRDQKSEAFFDAGARLVVDHDDERLWQEHQHDKEYFSDPEIKEKISEEIRVLQDTVKKLDAAELIDSCKDDDEQLALLEKHKANARKLIKEVLDRAIAYHDLVRNHRYKRTRTKQADGGTDARRLAKELEQIDRSRRLTHNSLISSLHSAVRFISFTFGNISEHALEEWEEKMEEQGRVILEVKRQDFDQNVICPEWVNLRDRDQVKEWVIQLYHYLIKFQKEFK